MRTSGWGFFFFCISEMGSKSKRSKFEDMKNVEWNFVSVAQLNSKNDVQWNLEQCDLLVQQAIRNGRESSYHS